MKLVSSREVFRTRIFHITEDVALDSDGFEISRAIIRHPGAAVVMPVDEEGRILLVRQFRLPARQKLWELCAGRLDPGETPLQAAKRELREETGYRARRWKKLAAYWPSPGFLEEKMHLYAATGITPGDPQWMDDERIETRWFTPAELDQRIGRGQIADGKTLVGFLAWRRYHAQSNP
jgi:ADP-ribose pyrophosphatase